eukprot:3435865-Pyramimonas_sp.AAC.1
MARFCALAAGESDEAEPASLRWCWARGGAGHGGDDCRGGGLGGDTRCHAAWHGPPAAKAFGDADSANGGDPGRR